MTEIDYEALAKAAYASYMGQRYPSGIRPDWEGTQVSQREIFQTEARAVVAAYESQLRSQGMVVVRRNDAETLRRFTVCALKQWAFSGGDLHGSIDRVGSALAAPGDGETT
jgi:hypothetical protein